MPTSKRMVAVYFDPDQHDLIRRAAARRKISAGALLRSFIAWREVKKMAAAEPLDGEVDPRAA